MDKSCAGRQTIDFATVHWIAETQNSSQVVILFWWFSEFSNLVKALTCNSAFDPFPRAHNECASFHLILLGGLIRERGSKIYIKYRIEVITLDHDMWMDGCCCSILRRMLTQSNIWYYLRENPNICCCWINPVFFLQWVSKYKLYAWQNNLIY